MINDKSITHIPTCAVGNQPKSYHEHKWSGWPGAYCLVCGCEDPDEICIGEECKCPCHDVFWDSYNAEMSRK